MAEVALTPRVWLSFNFYACLGNELGPLRALRFHEGGSRAVTPADVRYGLEADIGVGPRHVRFTPESGHHTPRPLVLNCDID
jgi:hypothetical protein